MEKKYLIESFEEFLNENKVTFAIDDGKLDDMFMDSTLSKKLDYKKIKGDTYYVLPKREYSMLVDMADSNGFDTEEIFDVIDESKVNGSKDLNEGTNAVIAYLDDKNILTSTVLSQEGGPNTVLKSIAYKSKKYYDTLLKSQELRDIERGSSYSTPVDDYRKSQKVKNLDAAFNALKKEYSTSYYYIKLADGDVIWRNHSLNDGGNFNGTNESEEVNEGSKDLNEQKIDSLAKTTITNVLKKAKIKVNKDYEIDGDTILAKDVNVADKIGFALRGRYDLMIHDDKPTDDGRIPVTVIQTSVEESITKD